MREKQILVVIKEPGKEAFIDPFFDNTLKAFQKQVGGYIETVRIAEDAVIICNEEGLLQGLPYNLTISGNHFVGTVMAVGVKGDEFRSLRSSSVPKILKMLNGESR